MRSDAGTSINDDSAVAGADIDVAVFDPHIGKYELDEFPGVVIAVTREEQQI